MGITYCKGLACAKPWVQFQSLAPKRVEEGKEGEKGEEGEEGSQALLIIYVASYL
jgi:hypothetical protein